MPRRTTPFQMVIHFVRKQMAAPGVTVSESKFLPDAALGVDREVDVVVEGEFDGDQVVTSVEVIEHSRAASITWVEQQIAKHRHLPTRHLVLVSKSGFSRKALKAVAVEGGWVEAVRPEVVEVDGVPVVRSLFLDTVNLTPISYVVHVRKPDGNPLVVRGGSDIDVYDIEGVLLGTLNHLVQEGLNLEWVKRIFTAEAHAHPERDDLKGFTLGLAIPQLQYCLLETESGELHPIEAFEVEGGFAFHQEEIAFTVTDLAGRRYGVGEAALLGRPAVWVATTDEGARTTTLSWRTSDDKPLFEPRQPRPMLFPGLLTVPPPT